MAKKLTSGEIAECNEDNIMARNNARIPDDAEVSEKGVLILDKIHPSVVLPNWLYNDPPLP